MRIHPIYHSNTMDNNSIDSDNNKFAAHLKNKKALYKIYLHNTRYDIIKKSCKGFRKLDGGEYKL